MKKIKEAWQAPSCARRFLKNEKTLITLKQGKLRKNRNQLKLEYMEVFICSQIDAGMKKEKRNLTANKRRGNISKKALF